MIDKIIERLEAEYIPEIEDEYDVGRNRGIDKAIAIVKKVASEGGWIKCSDSPPVFDKPFLVQLENNSGQKAMTVAEYKQFCVEGKNIVGWFTTVEPYGENALNEECVIAWQPLPEPFKESD